MKTMRPAYALLIILLIFGAVLTADLALDGKFSREPYTRVKPEKDGMVRLAVDQLEAGQVRFYRFLNYGNQEVRFFVGKDEDSEIHVAFDANEACYKLQRGYDHQDGWMVCNKCDKAFELKTVKDGGGGCSPEPIPYRLEESTLILSESNILAGWRFFR